MTNDEFEELLADCPRLYHMAAGGSWASIQAAGLLSTSALLDKFGVTGERRITIEERRRPSGEILEQSGRNNVVIRDQRPINERLLANCLLNGMTQSEWYRLLNRKVFFARL